MGFLMPNKEDIITGRYACLWFSTYTVEMLLI